MQQRFVAGLLLLGALATGACSSDIATTPTSTATAVSESFAGTLNKNGALTFQFASLAGGITATLTVLSPDSTAVVGLSLGTWSGSSCQVVLTNDSATQATVVSGSVSAAGTLCVRLSDVGKLAASTAFQVDVVHF